MQNQCRDSFYTTFPTYPSMLDYHEVQARNSQWKHTQVRNLEVELETKNAKGGHEASML